MAKTSRPKSKGKGKGKEKALMHQPSVVARTSPQTDSTHIIEQTIDPTDPTDPTDPMQPILDPAGVKLAAFMKSVQQGTALATQDPVLNKQQSFEAIQTMLHVSVGCPNSRVLRATLTIAICKS